MLGFAALAILALTTLRDEKVQTVTLLLLALFAFKTWLQHRKQRESEEN